MPPLGLALITVRLPAVVRVADVDDSANATALSWSRDDLNAEARDPTFRPLIRAFKYASVDGPPSKVGAACRPLACPVPPRDVDAPSEVLSVLPACRLRTMIHGPNGIARKNCGRPCSHSPNDCQATLPREAGWHCHRCLDEQRGKTDALAGSGQVASKPMRRSTCSGTYFRRPVRRRLWP